MWKNLPDKEKKKYYDLDMQDRKRYLDEIN